MQGVEELHPVEFEYQLPQYLLAQKHRLLATVEKHYPKQLLGLRPRHLAHEQLEIVDVELAVQQLVL